MLMRACMVFWIASIGLNFILIVSGNSAAAATSTPGAESIVFPGNKVVPLYPVVGDASVSAVGFYMSGAAITSYDQDKNLLWSTPTSDDYGIFGGIDFDSDGWPDVGYVYSQPSAQMCGNQAPLRA